MGIRALFRMAYPWAMTPDEEWVTFEISSCYGFSSSAAAHEFVLDRLARYEKAEFIDLSGASWEFYRGSVRTVVVWRRSRVST